jgi:Mlc titration factor MtfA (ptsG expression regulator)
VFGLFDWWKRRSALARPFPEAWRAHLGADVPFYARFDAAERGRFEDKLKVFVWTKHFFGAGGIADVDERMRVVIGAAAARMIMNMPAEHLARLLVIIVYPGAYRHDGGEEGAAIFGEAHRHATVVLSWEAVVHGLRNSGDGHDTALHEFAHVLDANDGQFDGTPTQATLAAYRPWARVMSEEFLRLRGRKQRGKRHVLREYGATNEAEFFAVATEAFFEKPRQLKEKHPALYALLADYFRADPAGR